MTGLTEAAKARTPLLLIAGEAPAAALRSNFRLDQAGLAETVGAVAERVHSGESAAADTARAFRRAEAERRPVLLSMPLDVQAQPAAARRRAVPALPAAPGARPPRSMRSRTSSPPLAARSSSPAAAPSSPARASRSRRSATRIGAVLATSAMGHGLFAGSPWAVGISGGFASPLAARLISSSDLILAFGAALTRWTTKDGSLHRAGAKVVHVDLEADAAHRPVDVAVIGDAAATARALLDAGVRNAGVRDDALAAEIAAGSWRDEPYEDARIAGRMDPRTLSHRARRAAARRAHRRRRLRPLHGLPADVPARARSGRLRVHPGVPVDRPRAGVRDRRGDRAAGSADRRLPRRRRCADVAARARDARPAEAADARRRSTTTPPTARRSTTSARTATRSSSSSSRTPTSRRWRRPRARAA